MFRKKKAPLLPVKVIGVQYVPEKILKREESVYPEDQTRTIVSESSEGNRTIVLFTVRVGEIKTKSFDGKWTKEQVRNWVNVSEEELERIRYYG